MTGQARSALPKLGCLDSLCECSNLAVDGMPLGLQTSQLGINVPDGRPKALDEFVFLQLGLWVLVLGKGGVDADVDGSGAGAVKYEPGCVLKGLRANLQ